MITHTEERETRERTAQERLEQARAHLAHVNTTQGSIVEQEQRLQSAADAADAEAGRLIEERTSLLSQLANGRDVEQQLRALAERSEHKRHQARDYRAAAELLSPQIQQQNAMTQAAARAVLVAELRIVQLEHLADCEALEAALVCAEPLFARVLASAMSCEAKHQQVFSRPSPLDDPSLRLARRVSTWGQKVLGYPAGQLLTRRWPPESGSLTASVQQLCERT